MYHKIKGGSTINIQGLECNLPPVGKVFNRFTNQLEVRSVYKRSEKTEEQYWEIPQKPKNVARLLIQEERDRQLRSTYFDSELQQYREREWDRRMNGFWFYNNGKPTFITGLHYFYLSHWVIDIGYPSFRITDMKWFYFWDYCVGDPECFGMTEVTQRRQGKSFRAGVVIYEATSRTKRKRSGIQSKDKEAAETFFDVHVVQPFTELEKIFKPTMDLDKGAAPKSIMRFFRTSTKGAAGVKRQEDSNERELRSRIDFQSSKNKAYDGKKLLIYIRDESGKVEEQGANVYVAHGIIKPCLTDGDKIIGKALYTTTVEDMRDDDDPEGNFKLLWDESDQCKKGKNNRTKSGLYRYFMAAYECMYFDIYGFADESKAREFHNNERANLTGQALADYIRRYPFSADEAFWTSREGGIFNPIPIENQRKALGNINIDDLYTIGNLHWEGGKVGTKVIFTETPLGKFKFHKKFNIREECEAGNSKLNSSGYWTPSMKATRIIGVDPVDHKLTEQSGSKASAHLYIKFNLSNELSETFVCEYLNRPEDPEIFYTDMGLLAFATGAELMVENQKPGLINYCNRVDFKNFIVNYGSTQGIPASSKNQRLLADVYEIYIEHNVEKIIYPNILSDLSVFNLIKTTKFDAAMSSGWALVGSYDERIVGVSNVSKHKPKIYDISDFI
jgi:hypothetical protein